MADTPERPSPPPSAADALAAIRARRKGPLEEPPSVPGAAGGAELPVAGEPTAPRPSGPPTPADLRAARHGVPGEVAPVSPPVPATAPDATPGRSRWSMENLKEKAKSGFGWAYDALMTNDQLKANLLTGGALGLARMGFTWGLGPAGWIGTAGFGVAGGVRGGIAKFAGERQRERQEVEARITQASTDISALSPEQLSQLHEDTEKLDRMREQRFWQAKAKWKDLDPEKKDNVKKALARGIVISTAGALVGMGIKESGLADAAYDKLAEVLSNRTTAENISVLFAGLSGAAASLGERYLRQVRKTHNKRDFLTKRSIYQTAGLALSAALAEAIGEVGYQTVTTVAKNISMPNWGVIRPGEVPTPRVIETRPTTTPVPRPAEAPSPVSSPSPKPAEVTPIPSPIASPVASPPPAEAVSSPSPISSPTPERPVAPPSPAASPATAPELRPAAPSPVAKPVESPTAVPKPAESPTPDLPSRGIIPLSRVDEPVIGDNLSTALNQDVNLDHQDNIVYFKGRGDLLRPAEVMAGPNDPPLVRLKAGLDDGTIRLHSDIKKIYADDYAVAQAGGTSAFDHTEVAKAINSPNSDTLQLGDNDYAPAEIGKNYLSTKGQVEGWIAQEYILDKPNPELLNQIKAAMQKDGADFFPPKPGEKAFIDRLTAGEIKEFDPQDGNQALLWKYFNQTDLGQKAVAESETPLYADLKLRNPEDPNNYGPIFHKNNSDYMINKGIKTNYKQVLAVTRKAA